MAARKPSQTEPPHAPSLAQQRTACVSLASAHVSAKELEPQAS